MRSLKTFSPALVNPDRRQVLRSMVLFGTLAGLPTAKLWAASSAASSQRIVSIGGALTEIAFALNASETLVGVDTTSLYPPEVSRLPSVGYARTLSSEGILALTPTQVVATEDAGPPAVLRQISSAGVPVKILPAKHRFEGVLDRVTQMGALLNRQNQAQQLTKDLQEQWQSVRAPIMARTTPPPRVLFVLSHRPSQVMVGGQDSSADAMLEYVGAINAIQGFSAYKPLSPEAIIAAQPDVVLFTEQGFKAIGGITGALKLPGLNQTPAGQKRRFIALEAMLLLGFGPRLPSAVAALDQALRQEIKA